MKMPTFQILVKNLMNMDTFGILSRELLQIRRVSRRHCTLYKLNLLTYLHIPKLAKSKL